MAINREDIIDIDRISGTVTRSLLNKAIGEGDANANRYGFRLFENKEPIDLSGCDVTGYFIRNDETTIIIDGETTGNEAYVVLPANCYVVEGNFTLAIKLSGGTVAGTMRIVDGTVINTTTDAVVDPGGAVPDITELIAVIERAEDAAEEIAEITITEELVEEMENDNDYRLIVDVEE